MWAMLALAWFGGFAGLGAYVAAQKRRPRGEGFFLGLLFGPLGALIVALLPTGTDAGSPVAPKAVGSWHGFSPAPETPPESTKPSRIGKPLRPVE